MTKEVKLHVLRFKVGESIKVALKTFHGLKVFGSYCLLLAKFEDPQSCCLRLVRANKVVQKFSF